VSHGPIFEHEIAFDPAQAAEALRQLPAGPAVVGLFGHSATDRPHLMKSANVRRRLQRLLEPAEGQTKRLNLRDRIARIAWREAGSEFESLLLLYRAMHLAFGAEEARKRMRLSPPFTVRFAAENAYPRIYVTNHLRRRSLTTTFGPFASRVAAERYCEAVEELFLIRRCYMELHPSVDDPGCIYGEMKKCMAPCQMRCSDAEYSAECEQVLAFLKTHGASRTAALEAERDEASAAMEFEQAAAVHARIAKVKAAADVADELVQPLSDLRAVLVMPCPSRTDDEAPHVAVWSFSDGCFRGPERVSLLGVRLAKEQAEVGSSLFAQPMMLAAVPSDGSSSGGSAEERMLASITRLFDGGGARDMAEFGDQLSLLKRWYYRPEKQRVGAIFFPVRGEWPVRKLVRAAAKLVAPAEVVAKPDAKLE
jgi:hypothetical protein